MQLNFTRTIGLSQKIASSKLAVADDIVLLISYSFKLSPQRVLLTDVQEASFLQLVEVDVSKCKYKCGEEHDNGRIRGTSGQYFKLKDGTPCGLDKVCIDGFCIETCKMPFV
uniref:Uncharacterized protein n=1 Tax=Ixodes ricinus TaxID=34613 RepID=A0A6B0UJW2_IXORI